MRNTFFEYNILDSDTLKHLWSESIFIFDTNVLLNLYRYSKETSDKFISIIKELQDRIVLPYQIGLEFNENRLSVIGEQKKLYSEFRERFNVIISDIENKNRNPFFSTDILNNLNNLRTRIDEEIFEKLQQYEISLHNDPILIQINDIFEGKINKRLEKKELQEIYKEGEVRYNSKIPPGYKDSKKEGNKKYGDLILWKEIIHISKSKGKNIIFVLDDRKEDWWLECQGQTISPRPELLREFKDQTSHLSHFYKPFQFLELYNQNSEKQINIETIEEVKNYKIENESDIQIKKRNLITVELLVEGALSDIILFLNQLKGAGYDFSHSITHEAIHQINITLPNIPDLIRRLKEKYIEKSEQFRLSIMDIAYFEV